MSAAERGPGPGSGGDGSGSPDPAAGPGRGPAAEQAGGRRKARGRPRLTESDRARRRLESRKKYDVRRVYLGEAHGPWVDLRRRSGWSDAQLAAYLLGLERGQRTGQRGKPWEQLPKKPKRKKRRRRNVNCLRHAALWYEDHRHRCPYEPRLAELEPALGLASTAVWQCERGHRYFQDLHPPPRPPSDSGRDSDDAAAASSSCSSGGCTSDSEVTPGGGTDTTPAVPTPAGPGPPDPEGRAGPGGGAAATALEAVVCVPLPLPLQLGGGRGGGLTQGGLLQGPPLLILASPSYEALGGLRLDLGGGTEQAQLEEGAAVGSLPPLDPHPPKTEEEELGLKQEELPPPPAEPPPQQQQPPQELPTPPCLAEDADGGEGSAIIYEIPQEPPRRRRSRRGRDSALDPEEPISCSRRGHDPKLDAEEPISCPYAGCGRVCGTPGSFQTHLSLAHCQGPPSPPSPRRGCSRRIPLLVNNGMTSAGP